MELATTRAQLTASLNAQRESGKCIGLVPTMGNLHDGHLALVKTMQKLCDCVVTSIFVNPLQFGAGEDLDNYPRTLMQDSKALEEIGCTILFAPEVSEIYPASLEKYTTVHVPDLGMRFCGSSRPGHFDGVTTVVNKLFNICQPDKACFGLKDYQQFLLIKKMTTDLALDIEIIGVETQRDKNGLALSSRNGYLSKKDRELASNLYKTLTECEQHIRQGERNFERLEQSVAEKLQNHGLRTDYVGICNAHTLQPPSEDDKELAVLAAAFIGGTRLIDNIRIDLAP